MTINYNDNFYYKNYPKEFNELVVLLKTSKRLVSKILNKKYTSLVNWINSVIPKLNDSKFTIATKLYWIFNGLTDFPKCQNPNCKHIMSDKNVGSLNDGYSRYCTSKCGLNDKAIKEKAAKTCLERYGEISPGKAASIKEKSKQTCLKKYGVEYSFQSENNKLKTKQTSLKKYGTELPSKAKEVINKVKETKDRIYGENQPWHSKESFNKRKENWNKKYGVDHPMKLEITKEKQRNTCLKKYNVDSIFKTKEFYYHVKELVFNRCIKNNPYDEPLFSYDEFINRSSYLDKFKFKCRKCGNIFESGHYNGIHRRCPRCFPPNIATSNEEKEIFSFISSFLPNVDIISRDRKTISPLELDIFIPKKKIAIEFDGLFWHSEQQGKNKNYHLHKTEECEKKGIQLIHIFEDEWLYKQDIVKSRLKNLLGLYDNKCFARQCEVREVSSKESFDFQEINHIQGAVNSKVNLGLYFKDELVSLMTFSKPRFDKKHEWELVRFCNKLGWHIPGAASKLLTHFEREYKPKNIVSYADRRWSKGNLYRQLGFKLSHISPPNYWYFNRNFKLESRLKFQKHKLQDILEHFDPKLSEVKNMEANEYSRIWDCGNLVFEK